MRGPFGGSPLACLEYAVVGGGKDVEDFDLEPVAPPVGGRRGELGLAKSLGGGMMHASGIAARRLQGSDFSHPWSEVNLPRGKDQGVKERVGGASGFPLPSMLQGGL